MRSLSSLLKSTLTLAPLTAALLASPSASAHCTVKSCELDESPSNPCERDQNACVTEGTPVFWPSSCLRFAVQSGSSATARLDADQLAELVQVGFETWRSVECPGGGSPSFDVAFDGFVACDRQDTVCGSTSDNVNVVMFHDSNWTYGSNRLALTSHTGSTKSGKLIDADIELNTQDFAFVPHDAPPGFTSLDRTLLHELGHFLGLGHSKAVGAIMAENYDALPAGAALSADDIAGICELFPPERGVPSCTDASPAYDQCAQEEGSQKACLASDVDGSGCSFSPASMDPVSPAGLVGLSLFALGALRRQARKVFSPRTSR